MDRFKSSVKRVASSNVNVAKSVSSQVLSKFHTAKDEYEVVDPEFNKYKELLEGQIKQVEQVQRSLVAFVQNVVGMMHSAMGLAESLEGFYLDRNGRDVGSKIMLTQLKVKMASQDFSDALMQANEILIKHLERLMLMRSKVASRDEMAVALQKAMSRVDRKRRKYEASKEKKLESLAKYDQAVATRDALKSDFVEKNEDVKLELMDLDANRALHIETFTKMLVRSQWTYFTSIADGCDILEEAEQVSVTRTIPTPNSLDLDSILRRKESHTSEEPAVTSEPSPFNHRRDSAPAAPSPLPSNPSPSSTLSASSSSLPSVMSPRNRRPGVPTGSGEEVPTRRSSASKPLPRLPPTPTQSPLPAVPTQPKPLPPSKPKETEQSPVQGTNDSHPMQMSGESEQHTEAAPLSEEVDHSHAVEGEEEDQPSSEHQSESDKQVIANNEDGASKAKSFHPPGAFALPGLGPSPVVSESPTKPLVSETSPASRRGSGGPSKPIPPVPGKALPTPLSNSAKALPVPPPKPRTLTQGE